MIRCYKGGHRKAPLGAFPPQAPIKNGALWKYHCGGIAAAGGPKLMFNIMHSRLLEMTRNQPLDKPARSLEDIWMYFW